MKYKERPELKIWCKSNAHSVYRHTCMEENDSASLVLHTGRNMTAVAQIFLWHSWIDFDINGWETSDLPSGVSVTGWFQGYHTFNDGVPYPDRMTSEKNVTVKANTAQGIVLRFQTAPDAETGIIHIRVTVKTHNFKNGDLPMTADIFLHVHSTVLPEPKDCSVGHEYHIEPFVIFKPEFKSPFEPFYPYAEQSDGWWELVAAIARETKTLRINTLYINPIPLLSRGAGTRKTGENTWHLDYSFLDRYVRCFLDNGSFKTIALAGLVQWVTGETIDSFDEEGKVTKIPLKGDRAAEAAAWQEAYFTDIIRHFKEKGWADRMVFHLQDEPHAAESWLWARAICRKVDPNAVCMEPIDTYGMARSLGDNCDIPVPRLEIYQHDMEYFDEYREKGNKVWCYSCCAPNEPGWLNKFIDLPSRYSRMLSWACFTQELSGFLHWGFCHWDVGSDPGNRFKGDGFIVYPDVPNNGVLPSNRGLATTEGMEEWELLTQLKKYAPDTAEALARKIAKSFDNFNPDPKALDAARAELLTMLDAYTKEEA